jgi:hypothetical protein
MPELLGDIVAGHDRDGDKCRSGSCDGQNDNERHQRAQRGQSA